MGFDITRGPELLECFDALDRGRTYARTVLAERRLGRLLASPAGLFRGCPALFYALAGRHASVPALVATASPSWIVGDVHMENVGVIAVGDHQLVFDWNDLDEAVLAPPILDLLRGVASAASAAESLDLGPHAALRAAEAFLVSYVRPLAPVMPHAVGRLMDRARRRTHTQLLDERCPEHGGVRRFVLGKRYLGLEGDEPQVIEALFDAYAAQDPLGPLDKRLRLEDAAFRVQGTGSLGVRRFIVLARAGKKGAQMLFEAKEIRRSAAVVGGVSAEDPGTAHQAARVEKAMTALLAQPQVGVRAMEGIDGASYLVRLHAPGEDKLAIEEIEDQRDLEALARMIGHRLSQAHERAAGRPVAVLDLAETLSTALDLGAAITRAHLALVVRHETAARA